ncbi:MAG: hypothetical protein ACLRZH_13140 [Ruthenibacterium lactatiformans]
MTFWICPACYGKFDSMEVAATRAFIGSIKDDVLDIEALATALLGEMQRMYPSVWRSVTD